jgi:amino acid transporter
MAKPLVTTSPVSPAASSAAQLSIASGVLFVLLLGSLHVLEPEFNPTWRFVSEYALGAFGWMMRLAFLALATSLTSAGVAILSQVRTVTGYIGLVGLGIAGIGFLIAAIFTTDPATTSREAATFSGKMHVFGASLGMTPGGPFGNGYLSPQVSRWSL